VVVEVQETMADFATDAPAGTMTAIVIAVSVWLTTMGTQVVGVAILETQEAVVAHGAATQIQVGAVIVEAIIGQLTPTPSIAIAAPARLLPRAGNIVPADVKITIITIKAVQDLHGIMEEVTIPVGG
jgi:hypothetical protein